MKLSERLKTAMNAAINRFTVPSFYKNKKLQDTSLNPSSEEPSDTSDSGSDSESGSDTTETSDSPEEHAFKLKQKLVAMNQCKIKNVKKLETHGLTPDGKINGYRATEKLGEGSFGRVFLAEKDDKWYILKLLTSQASYQQEKQVLCKLLGNAAKKTCNIKEQICFIEDFKFELENQDPGYVIVTSYLTSATLQDVFDGSVKLNDLGRINLLKKLLLRLKAIHKNGIIHGDIKPNNIIVQINSDTGNFENVLFIDYGLSCVQEKCYVTGTPLFMAPEVYPYDMVSFEEGTKTDFYSLGIVAYMLFNGYKFPNGTDNKKISEEEFKLLKWKEIISGYTGPESEYVNGVIHNLTNVDANKRQI